MLSKLFFPDHVTGKFCAIILTLGPLGVGTAKKKRLRTAKMLADISATQIVPTCATILLVQRVWGRDDIS
jgi:hypothetical protein